MSRSRLGLGLTQFCISFLRYRAGGQFRSEKKGYIIGSGSHVPSETSKHRPSTALKLGSDDSQLSGPVSGAARTRGSAEVPCAKTTLFVV